MSVLEKRGKISNKSVIVPNCVLEIKWKQVNAPWHSFSLGAAEARTCEVVKTSPGLARYI